MKRTLRYTLAVLLAAAALSACRGPIRHPDWAPDVRTALNDFLSAEKNAENRYVVFDFDNTCSIFDVSEQLEIYQLETMGFGLDPAGFARMARHGLEDRPAELLAHVDSLVSLYSALYERYGPFSYAGVDGEKAAKMHADPAWQDFAAGMTGMYTYLQNYLSAYDTYLWILGWFSGMTGDEVYDMAFRSHRHYAAVETSRRVWKGMGPEFAWIDGIQVTEPVRELWKALADRGFDIWVCSASEIAPVMAAVDAFGLHEACTGVLAMTMARDSAGRYLPEYDFTDGCAYLAQPGGGWVRDTVPTRVMPFGAGKVAAIRSCVVPRYGGKGPLAGFMDSTGDFNFCTEFSSMRLCVCFNRATRTVADGGGLISEVAVYQKEDLHYNLRRAGRKGDVLYLLQGRDENGLRRLRPGAETLRFGADTLQLFATGENAAALSYFREKQLSVKEILETFSLRTAADDPANPLGFPYGFLSEYAGYRSRE